MQTQRLLQIDIPQGSKNYILEKIKRVLIDRPGFFHIVSLNPEIMMAAQRDPSFKTVLDKANLALIDGVGIIVACNILGISHGERTPGSQLVIDLFSLANTMSLRILLIGGRPNLADKISACQSRSYPKAKFLGLEGHRDVHNPTQKEFENIRAIVRDYRPHIVLVAFGSPQQEQWIWSNRHLFKDAICMGVGGTFDYLGGLAVKPPHLINVLGFEWLFRLMIQPWRWRRQLNLLSFLAQVVLIWTHGIIHPENESR